MKDLEKLSKTELIAEIKELRKMQQSMVENATEKRAAEIKLKESEAKLRILYNNSPDMYVSVSPDDASILLCNETLLKATGYSKEEVIGSPIFKMYHDECMADVRKVFEQFVETGEIKNKELILKRKDGSKIDVSLNVYGIKDETGKTLYSMSSWRDITERVQAEAEIIKNTNILNDFMNNSSALFYIVDTKGRFISANNKLEKLFGKTQNELIGKEREEIMPKEIAKRHSLNDQKVINGKQLILFEEVNHEADGKHYYQTQKFPIFDAENNIYAIGGISTDITVIKQLEEKMNESLIREKRMADIVRESFVGIVIGYSDGRLGMCNLAYQQITGYSEEELKTIDWNKKLTPPEWEESELAKLQEVHRTKKPVKYEKEYIRKDGSRVPIELLVNPRFDDNGEVEFYFGFVIDITERKQAEKNLLESEEKFRNLYSNSPFGIMICSLIRDSKGKIIDFIHKEGNPSIEPQTGFKLNDLVGKKASEIVDDKVLVDLVKKYGDVVSTGQTINYTQYFAIYDRTLDVRVYPLHGDIFTISFIDISTKIKVENKLNESEEKFRGIFEQSPLGIQIYNVDGKLIDVNQHTLNMFGVDDKKYIIEFNLWEDPNLSSEKKKALKNGKPVFISADLDFEIIKKNNIFPTSRSGIIYVDMYVNPLMQENKVTGYLVQIVEVTDSKLAEQTLKESEEKLNRSQEVGKIGHWEFDLNNNKLIWSNQVFALYERDLKIGQPSDDEVGNYYSEKDHKRLREYMVQIIETAKPVENFECPIILPSGRIIITLGSMFPVMDSNGTIIKIFGVLQDITERKLAEEALKESEAHAKILFDYASIPIWEEDFSEVKIHLDQLKKEGVDNFKLFFEENPDEIYRLASMIKIVQINQKSKDFYGVNSIEELVTNLPDWFIEDSWKVFKAEIITLAEGKVSFESEIPVRTTEGEIKLLFLQLSIPPANVDDFKRVMVSFIDITERKLAEEALKENEDRWRSLVTKFPGMVYQCKNDKEWTMNYLNEECFNLTGYKVEEIIGNKLVSYNNLIHPDDQELVKESVLDGISQNKNFEITYRIINRLGEEKWVWENGSGNFSSTGELLFLEGIILDITDKQLADTELKKYKENLEKIVEERTKNLEEKNKELERFNDLFVDREFRIKELREEIMQLKLQ